MQNQDIINKISDMSLFQRISIIESLLESVKNDILKSIEKDNDNNIRLFYQMVMLNNEASVLNTLLKLPEDNIPFEKGDKSIDPTALFGIWENNPKDITEIRKQDWQRNWDL